MKARHLFLLVPLLMGADYVHMDDITKSWLGLIAECNATTGKLNWDATAEAFKCDTDGTVAGGGITTVEDIDSVPTYGSLSLLSFDQADGFVITNPAAGEAQIDLAALPAGVYGAASIDGDDVASSLAGRSLTLTAASPDTLDADAELYTDVKCINIDPNNNDTTDWFMWKAPFDVTITGVDCIVDATTSVVLTPNECDANGGTCTAIEAALSCAVTNTAEAGGSVDNPGIDAGDWIRVVRSTVVGSPTQATLCLEMTYDD